MKQLLLVYLCLPFLLLNACSKHDNATPANNNQSDQAKNNLVVYAASDIGILYALDANSGRVIWTFRLNPALLEWNQLSSPAYADSILYVGSTDQNIYAINAITGKEVWRYHTNSTPGFFYSSPVVAGGSVYVGGYEKRFYALDAKTGQLKWQRDFPAEFESSPAFYNGTVFASTNNGILYALNAANGNTIWSQGGAGYYGGFHYGASSPAVKNGVVYSIVKDISGASSLINELNVIDGTGYGIYSEFDMSSPRVYFSSPVIDDSIAFFAAGDSLYATKTGALLFLNKQWSFGAGKTITSSPSYDDSTVYTGCDDGYLYAVNKFNGRLKWKYNSLSKTIASSPVIVNGVVFFGTSDKFIAVNARDGSIKWQTTEFTPVDASPVVITRQGTAHHGSISGMTN